MKKPLLSRRSTRRMFELPAPKGKYLVAAGLAVSTAAFAGTASWNTDNNGNWTSAGNWTAGGPPNGAADIANLNFNITADRVITLDAPQTIGGLNIGDPAGGYFSYTISGSNALSTAGAATILKSLDTASQAHDVIAVPITLGGDLTIDQKSRGSVLEFSGSIGNDGSPRNVTIFGNGANSLTNFAMVVFSAANSYGGTTTIGTGGVYAGGAGNGSVLRITHSQALGTGNVAITGGMNTPRLELAGGITVSNNITSVNGSDNADFRPRLVSVSGANEWAGNITGITTGGGHYPIHSTGTASGDFFTISGNIVNQRTQTETRNLRFGGAGDGEVTGRIEDGTSGSAWNVFKDDAGTWTFSNANNTYRGTTTVNAGTLLVNGTHTGGGDYLVGANATLGGTGTIGSNVLVNGAYAPGTSIGQQDIAGDLTITATGVWEIEYDGGANTIDLVDVTGTIDLAAGATILFADIGSGALTAPAYIFATYGAFAGDPSGLSIENVPAGYDIDYAYNGNSIALVAVIPEPGALALAAIGVAGLGMFRVRRK